MYKIEVRPGFCQLIDYYVFQAVENNPVGEYFKLNPYLNILCITILRSIILCMAQNGIDVVLNDVISSPAHACYILVPSTWQDSDIQKGLLQRKNELDEGGRKAAARSWKIYHTVFIGLLLNFYKDRKDFVGVVSACPPINVSQGSCEVARDYQKKKYVLRFK